MATDAGTQNCIPFVTCTAKSSHDHPLRVDRAYTSVHFWDPMQNRVILTAADALARAAKSHAQGMTMITTIITTTRERGTNG